MCVCVCANFVHERVCAYIRFMGSSTCVGEWRYSIHLLWVTCFSLPTYHSWLDIHVTYCSCVGSIVVVTFVFGGYSSTYCTCCHIHNVQVHGTLYTHVVVYRCSRLNLRTYTRTRAHTHVHILREKYYMSLS